MEGIQLINTVGCLIHLELEGRIRVSSPGFLKWVLAYLDVCVFRVL